MQMESLRRTRDRLHLCDLSIRKIKKLKRMNKDSLVNLVQHIEHSNQLLKEKQDQISVKRKIESE